jgi:hypothetical protein
MWTDTDTDIDVCGIDVDVDTHIGIGVDMGIDPDVLPTPSISTAGRSHCPHTSQFPPPPRVAIESPPFPVK